MKKSILILEDNESLGRALARFLSTQGFEVSTAAEGKYAWSRLDQNLPDILIVDLGLPDCDGLDLIQFIRCSRPTLPVIAMTANDSQDKRKRASDLGVSRFLTKPFPLKTLGDAVREQVSARPGHHDGDDQRQQRSSFFQTGCLDCFGPCNTELRVI